MYYQNPVVQSEIRKRARAGRVVYSTHGEDQSENRGIDDLDILECLQSGLLEGEDWDAKCQDTTYRMAKNHNLSSKLIVIVALSESHDIVVTTFMKERK